MQSKAGIFENKLLSAVTALYVRRLNSEMKSLKLTYVPFSIDLNEEDRFSVEVKDISNSKKELTVTVRSRDQEMTIGWGIWLSHLNSVTDVSYNVNDPDIEYLNSVLLAGMYEYLSVLCKD